MGRPELAELTSAVIIAVLLMLSGTLMATTLFPHLDAARIAVWLAAALGAGLAATESGCGSGEAAAGLAEHPQ